MKEQTLKQYWTRTDSKKDEQFAFIRNMTLHYVQPFGYFAPNDDGTRDGSSLHFHSRKAVNARKEKALIMKTTTDEATWYRENEKKDKQTFSNQYAVDAVFGRKHMTYDDRNDELFEVVSQAWINVNDALLPDGDENAKRARKKDGTIVPWINPDAPYKLAILDAVEKTIRERAHTFYHVNATPVKNGVASMDAVFDDETDGTLHDVIGTEKDVFGMHDRYNTELTAEKRNTIDGVMSELSDVKQTALVMLSHGYTQAETATALHVSRATVNRISHDVAKITKTARDAERDAENARLYHDVVDTVSAYFDIVRAIERHGDDTLHGKDTTTARETATRTAWLSQTGNIDMVALQNAVTSHENAVNDVLRFGNGSHIVYTVEQIARGYHDKEYVETWKRLLDERDGVNARPVPVPTTPTTTTETTPITFTGMTPTTSTYTHYGDAERATRIARAIDARERDTVARAIREMFTVMETESILSE